MSTSDLKANTLTGYGTSELTLSGSGRKIAKLGVKNFETWKIAMKVILRSVNLWDVTQDAPKKGEKTYLEVFMQVEPINYVLIDDLECGREAFEALKKTYMKDGLNSKLMTMKKLMNLKWTEGTVDEHCQEFHELKSRCKQLKALDEETIMLAAFLGSLPERYEPYIMSLDGSGVEPTLEEVLSSVRNMKMEEPVSVAFRTEKGKKRRKPFKCYGCGKVGHKEADCKEPKAAFTVARENSAWVLDSGSAEHLTYDENELEEVTVLNKPVKFYSANSEFTASKIGKLNLNGIRVEKIFIVPTLRAKLLSLSKLARRATIEMTGTQASVRMDKSELVFRCINGTYKLTKGKPALLSLREAHKRFGHVDIAVIKQMNLPLSDTTWNGCDECSKGKLRRKNIPKTSNEREFLPGEALVTDCWGPTKNPGMNGERYFILIIDKSSNYMVTVPIRNKSECTQIVIQYAAWVQRQTGNKLRVLKSDGGGEFCNKTMQNFTRIQGIEHQKTTPGHSFQNGRAERGMRTLLDGVRTLLNNKPTKFWTLALEHYTNIRNSLPTNSNNSTAWQKIKGTEPRLNDILEFYTAIIVKKRDGEKLSPRGEDARYVGFPRDRPGILAVTSDGKIRNYRDFQLTEESRNTEKQQENEDESDEEIELLSYNAKDETERLPAEEQIADESEEEGYQTANDEPEPKIVNEKPKLKPTKPKNDRIKTYRDRKYTMGGRIVFKTSHDEIVATTNNEKIQVTGPIEALIAGKQSLEWKNAIDSEIRSLEENEVYELVPKANLTKDQKVLPSKFIYTIKTNPDNTIKHKARLVCGGHKQTKGVDFNEIYASVVKKVTLRSLIAVCAQPGWHLLQADFRTAFLNAPIEEETYVKPPKEMEMDAYLMRLKKSLYGTHQAPANWQETLNTAMNELGFDRSFTDPNSYVKEIGPDKIIVLIYVDDLIIGTTNTQRAEEFLDQVGRKFRIKKLGEAKKVLGIEIERMKNGLLIHQESYTNEILERFGFQDSNPAKTPYTESKEKEKEKEKETETECPERQKWYQEVVGSLLHLSINTRPDIAYAVGKAGEACKNPNEKDVIAVKRILRYLNGTRDMGILYQSTKSLDLVAFSDADFANGNDRVSRTGGILMLSSAPVAWLSKKQKFVTVSTVEAEYVAANLVASETIGLKNLLMEWNLGRIPIPRIFMDNSGAIRVAQNKVGNSRTKHLDVKYRFIQDREKRKDIEINYVPTEEMKADGLTKGLTGSKFRTSLDQMGLRKLQPESRGSVGARVGQGPGEGPGQGHDNT